MLEKLLCSIEEASTPISQTSRSTCQDVPDLEEFVYNFYTGYPNCKDFIADFYTVTRNSGSNIDEIANDAVLILEQGNVEGVSKSRERKGSPEADNELLAQHTENSPSHTINQEDSSSASRATTLRHDSSGSSDFYSCTYRAFGGAERWRSAACSRVLGPCDCLQVTQYRWRYRRRSTCLTKYPTKAMVRSKESKSRVPCRTWTRGSSYPKLTRVSRTFCSRPTARTR
jgi:hypothetical protein